MHRFRGLEVWRRSREAAIQTYRITSSFPPSEKFGLSSQLQRAAVSIGTNIAEGSKRGSDRDFAHFLTIAEGSAAEAWYLLDIGTTLGYVSPDDASILSAEFERLERMICGLRKQLGARRSPTA